MNWRGDGGDERVEVITTRSNSREDGFVSEIRFVKYSDV